MFLEIGVPKMLTKPWKVDADKFTFISIKAWKPTTALHAKLFIRVLLRAQSDFFLSSTVLENCKYFSKLSSFMLVISEWRHKISNDKVDIK